MKTPFARVVPGALLVAAAGTALSISPDASFLAQAAYGYPYVAFAAALLLAYRMQRSRLFTATAVIATAFIVLQPSSLGENPLASALIAAFVPVGLGILSFAPYSAFSASGIRRHLALLLGPIAIAAFFSAGNPAGTVELLTSRLGGIPAIALISAVATIAAIVAAVRSRRPTETGIAWAIVALALALAAPTGSTPRAIWMLGCGLLLIVALVETAYAMAYHDELTGLPGRRALTQALAVLEAPFAIAVVDVDHFKSFNDRHGHDVGDQVLCMVAARLRAVRGGGRAFRSGGEEFTLVFPAMSKREALPFVEAVRENVESAAFTLRGNRRPRGKKGAAARGRGAQSAQTLNVTVSIGIASSTARNDSVEGVMKAADKAMYRAKLEGRNRVVA